jgi:uncharacterized membrane protein
MINHNFFSNPIYVLSVLALMIVLGYYVSKTKYGKRLGIALLVIVFTAVVANLKLIPSASNSIPLYDGIFTYVAPISIFYLLLNVNLKSLLKAGRPMIFLFLIGSIATTIGILAAYYFLSPQDILGDNGKIIAGMLTGTYTGGSVNFNAVAIEYDFQDQGVLYAGTIAVDNVVTTIWIVITLSIPTVLGKIWNDKNWHSGETKTHKAIDDSIDSRSFIWLVFIGLFAYFISDIIKSIFPQIPFMLTISTIGIILAQLKFITGLKGSHTLGLYLVYIFLAVIGAYCEISSVIKLKETGLTLFLFTSLGVLIHGLILIFLGRLLYKDWDMIAIASQANIGGGTTAIALAETFEREELVLPAILVGTLGNALGTYLGFLVIAIL